MSEYLDDNENNEQEPEELYEEFKEEQDEFNDSDEFFNLYGFQHNCRCADDWAEGNLGVVSVCYLEMCREGLEKLKDVKKELNDKEATIAQQRIQLVEAGVDPEA